jgi:DNA-binding transcriptional ArsR family regulator
MAPDRSTFSPGQMQALSHPIRLRIVEMLSGNRDRSLSIADLTADLGDDFGEVTAAQVNYHLRCLQRVGLVPALTWG